MADKKKVYEFADLKFETPEQAERRVDDVIRRFNEMEEFNTGARPHNNGNNGNNGTDPVIYSNLKSFPVPGWEEVFGSADDIIRDICENVESYGEFYPQPEYVFNAFRAVGPIENVRVVIVGQDPYPTRGIAYGMSFSTAPGITKIPASLRVVFKEIRRTYPYVPEPSSGYLGSWCQQGVLLLNTSLTLSPAAKTTIQHNFWMTFINVVLSNIVKKCKGVIFVLWGKPAQGLIDIIGTRVISLTAGHPSPQNVKSTFNGCGHFVQINKYLTKEKHDQIMHGFSRDKWPEIYRLFNSGQGIFTNMRRWMSDQRYREMFGCFSTIQTPEVQYLRTLPGYEELMILIKEAAILEIEWTV